MALNCGRNFGFAGTVPVNTLLSKCSGIFNMLIDFYCRRSRFLNGRSDGQRTTVMMISGDIEEVSEPNVHIPQIALQQGTNGPDLGHRTGNDDIDCAFWRDDTVNGYWWDDTVQGGAGNRHAAPWAVRQTLQCERGADTSTVAPQ